MTLNMTSKDRQILQYCCENFTCKICNSVLIQCVTLPCGHNYCNYCLDLLHSEMSHQCPQCSSPFIRAQPNNMIDQQIDNLIHSCSESIQKAYVSALNSRFEKSMERNKKQQNEGRFYCRRNECNESKPSNCLDEIRNTLKMNDINPHHSVSKSLKSARKHRRAVLTPSNVVPGERQSSRPRSKPLTIGSINNASKPCETRDAPEIDMDKVNMLFGIYDHVLRSENEPNKEMASGDFVRDQDFQNVEAPFFEEMQNFTQRSEIELQTLIKETDDIVKLDDHIQKWTNKMNDALGGGGAAAECIGMPDEKFDKNVRIVDDELWKASNELLQKLQGMQKQRKMAGKSHISFSCPPTPLPRSCKLNVDAVSDDSDVEEYEQALENLQVCLDSSYDTSTQTQARDLKQNGENQGREEMQKQNCLKQDAAHQDSHANNDKSITKNSSGCRSARKKSSLDCMEESGHQYIKENIKFITKMRKYKEALMKIQNREVVTAQEIKELVPTRIFPSNEQDAPTILKCGDASTPRRISQISQGSRRPTARNPSYSARLPVSASMERRPMTVTYELPATQLIHKQIAVAPSKPYLSRQRARASNNSLFTAR